MLWGCSAAPTGFAEGQQAPAWSLAVEAVEGGPAREQDLSRPGATTALVFWASWSGASRRELGGVPFEDLDAEVILVNVGEPAGVDKRRSAALAPGASRALDPAPLCDAVGVDRVPLVVVLDPDGRVRYRGSEAQRAFSPTLEPAG